MSKTNITSDNNRIMKNTMILYLRMILIMIVKLYTSRIVLASLGIQDYGIYNVVGGIVVLFDFINNAMVTSTQRYITYEIGRGDINKFHKIFITSINVHIIISLIIIFLSETFGLWLLFNKMVFPKDMMGSAFCVFQLSVITTVMNVMSCPYNALIIAHERMSAFAYISILEVFAKFCIAILLTFLMHYKLIVYALLTAILQIVIRLVYTIYCKRNFEGVKYHIFYDKRLFKEMTSFAGWNLIGNMAGVLSTQGQNILLNMFFGPAVNAARAIAIQIQTTLSQFTYGFQTSLNPQITKNFALGNLIRMHSLIYRSSKISFLLLLVFIVPIFFEAPQILSFWLEIVPKDTVIFLRYILIISLIDSSANSLMVSAAATGKVKLYQLVCGGIILLIAPITYIAFKLGAPAYIAFSTHLFFCCAVYIARLLILRKMILLSIKEFFRKVVARCIYVTVTSIIIPCILFVFTERTPVNDILVIICCISVTILSSYFIGLTTNERKFIIAQLREKLLRKTIR